MTAIDDKTLEANRFKLLRLANHVSFTTSRNKAEWDLVLDGLLALCDGGECSECGVICCPQGEWLHFHHDGCPSCSSERRE